MSTQNTPTLTTWILGILGAVTAALLVAFSTNLMGKVSNTELTIVRMEGEMKAIGQLLGAWTSRVEKLERESKEVDNRLDELEKEDRVRRRADGR